MPKTVKKVGMRKGRGGTADDAIAKWLRWKLRKAYNRVTSFSNNAECCNNHQRNK
jgi:hypothetical protein